MMYGEAFWCDECGIWYAGGGHARFKMCVLGCVILYLLGKDKINGRNKWKWRKQARNYANSGTGGHILQPE